MANGPNIFQMLLVVQVVACSVLLGFGTETFLNVFIVFLPHDAMVLYVCPANDRPIILEL